MKSLLVKGRGFVFGIPKLWNEHNLKNLMFKDLWPKNFHDFLLYIQIQLNKPTKPMKTFTSTPSHQARPKLTRPFLKDVSGGMEISLGTHYHAESNKKAEQRLLRVWGSEQREAVVRYKHNNAIWIEIVFANSRRGWGRKRRINCN